MSAFHLHINIIERRSPLKPDPTFRAISSRFSSLGASPRAGKLGSRHARCRNPHKNPHPACRAHDDHRMMSRPLVSTIATVDRADAPKSNQEGEEKSGLSY
jgi:hypothetical protein